MFLSVDVRYDATGKFDGPALILVDDISSINPKIKDVPDTRPDPWHTRLDLKSRDEPVYVRDKYDDIRLALHRRYILVPGVEPSQVVE